MLIFIQKYIKTSIYFNNLKNRKILIKGIYMIYLFWE